MVKTGLRNLVWIMALALPLVLAGCDENCLDEDCCDGWVGDGRAPAIPVGVTSTTGDGEVYLDWIEVQDTDLAGYRVYVSDRPDGRYESIGETGRNHFVDQGLRNGRTYYYAVTAFDHCNNESPLSYENVHDTPRPEGFDLILTSRPSESGYDFSAFHRQGPGEPGTDIYLQLSGNVLWMVAGNPAVGLQDVGYLKLDGLDWAPDGGWSDLGRVELIEGHTYAVVTADDHFAKFYVVSLSGDRATLDWAYQVDRGNRELSVGAPVTAQSPNPAGSAKQGTGPSGIVPFGGTSR